MTRLFNSIWMYLFVMCIRKSQHKFRTDSFQIFFYAYFWTMDDLRADIVNGGVVVVEKPHDSDESIISTNQQVMDINRHDDLQVNRKNKCIFVSNKIYIIASSAGWRARI